MPRLVVFRGDAVESEIRLTGNPVRIGRHTGNDVVLDDSLNGVSRFHAEIRPEGNSYSIVDMNSRNGVWVNGKRIKDKAPFVLGVPVTVGAFELTLEDDASGSFDALSAGPRTVAVTAPPSVGDTSGSRRVATPPRPVAPAVSADTRRMLIWSGAAALVILICAVTYYVVRHRTPPPAIVANLEPPPPVVVPVETPPPVVVEDPNKALNEQDLIAAREMMAAGDNAGALRDHLQPVLEREPENAAALELKQQADQAIADATVKPKPRATPKPDQPAEVETPGIPRRAGESFADYTARVRQLQATLAEGRNALEKPEYAIALARFRAVDREAPKFQGVDALIADTAAKQQKAVEVALDSGQQNEQSGKLMDARRWYEVALHHDPTSVSAREKRAAVASKMNAAAELLFGQASYALKAQNPTQAIRIFQQVIDSTSPGDEYHEKAAKQLELLKR